MTDIDFDELDKAVNSLMGNVGNKDKEEGPKENTFTVSSTLKPGEKPSYDKLGEVAKQIGSETLVGRGELTIVEDLPSPDDIVPTESKEPEVKESSEPPAAPSSEPKVETEAKSEKKPEKEPEPKEKPSAPVVKRPHSGRFMDFVQQPSSVKPSSPATSISVAEKTVTPPVVSEPVLTVTEEVHEITQKKPETELSELTPLEPQVEQAAIPPIDSAPLTPFLPDAKVEKRPLGDPSANPQPANKESELAGPTENETGDATLPANQAADTQKPIDASEFPYRRDSEDQKLQLIESGELQAAQSPASIREIESGDTEHINTSLTADKPSTPANPPATAGDIYNVSDYHQPLTHPAKQKSGWGIVVIILLIIIVCAAIGAAAYFLLGVGI